MAESLTEPKKHLALDMDWASALGAVSAFFLCAFLAVATTWMTLRASFSVTSPSWWTPVFAAGLIYAGFSVPERKWRFGIFFFCIGPVSRIVLWLMKTSYQTRLTNEIFVRWIDSALYGAICVYIICGFRTKITHV
jgi:hypothetical protein